MPPTNFRRRRHGELTLAESYYHDDKKRDSRHSGAKPDLVGDDPTALRYDAFGNDYEDELSDQLAKLPHAEQINELCSFLRAADIRELSKDVVNGGIELLKGNSGTLEYARLINSWVATAEETLAAGRNVNRIAARRARQAQLR